MPPKKNRAHLIARGKQLYAEKLAVRRRREEEARREEEEGEGGLLPMPSQSPAQVTQPQKQPVDCLHQDRMVSAEGERSLDIRKKVLSDAGFRKEPSSGDHILLLKDKRLEKLVNNLAKCSICNGSGTLVTEREQFEVDIIVKCDTCDEILYEDKSEKVSDEIAAKKELGDSNLRMVYASMLNDNGNSGLMRECAVLGVGHFSQAKYQKYKKTICKTVEEQMKEFQKKSVEGIFKYYKDELGIEPDADGVLNIDVSFDGTWMTRGHRSKVGVSFVIECNTGIVVDFEVLSSFCHGCVILESKKTKNIISKEKYKIKKEKHKIRCKANYSGSSGGMEKEAACRLWSRSLDHKLRYTVIVSDGDTNTYKSILELNDNEGPYGLNHPVVKEECKNHLHKRLGSRIFSLKRQMREKRETATGKIQFRTTLQITDKAIEHLQRYFLAAVNRHIGGNWKDLKIDIMSTFFHCSSTDENPRHQLCSDKWCLFKQDELAGRQVRPHSEMRVAIRSSDPDVLKKIHEIYQDLTREELLQRCLKGRTQNPNESFHSKLWAKCSKVKFAGYDKVLFAAQVTVIQHNFGYQEGSLLSFLGISSPKETRVIEEKFEKIRSTSTPGRKRKRIQTLKDNDYAAGSF